MIARARVGDFPIGGVIDENTDTIYVTNGSGTVSVVNGTRCNASVTTGCGKPIATITVGGSPVAAAFNPATKTVYVASLAGQVFVIDAANCNALTSTGCGEPVKTINDSLGPDAIDVDVATDTVYASNGGPSGNSGDTVSVINGATCNGSTGSGCGQNPSTITVGSGTFWDVVDQATNTIYVANYYDGTVSVINGATCNAEVTSGCGQTPPVVPTGGQTSFVTVDDSTHTAFAVNQLDDTISAIDTRTCDGTVTTGCSARPSDLRATFNAPPGGQPNFLALDPTTQTAFVTNVGGQAFLQPVSVGHCNALTASGCRVEAPSAPNHDALAVVDEATNTIYAGNDTNPNIDVLNAATCKPNDLAGCAPVAEIPVGYPQANVTPGSIDDATRTLYSANSSGNYISVINLARCNAAETSGCAKAVTATITVGAAPGPPVLDPETHTLYAPYGASANNVAVIDAATCNAQVTDGCGQNPPSVTVGPGTFMLGVSVKTDTVYAPSSGTSLSSPGDTVAVINGATCNAIDHSGCGHLAATVEVGLGPNSIAVDDLTDTVYVGNFRDADIPGTLSIINSATCNGAATTGCSYPTPTISVGSGPFDVAVDSRTGFVYVADFASAAVSVLDGATCNAHTTNGCASSAREQPVGSLPDVLAISQSTNTVYTMTSYGAGAMSIFDGSS